MKKLNLTDMLEISNSNTNTEKSELKQPNAFTKFLFLVKCNDLIFEDLNPVVSTEYCEIDGRSLLKITPKINPQFQKRYGLKKTVNARDYIECLLKMIGFKTYVDTSKDGADKPCISVFVPIKNKKNMRLIRVSSAYMEFEKGKALTQEILDNIQRQK